MDPIAEDTAAWTHHGHSSPVKPADQNVTGEAHSSPELQAAVAQLPGQTARLQLGHGRQLGDIMTFDVERCEGEKETDKTVDEVLVKGENVLVEKEKDKKQMFC